MSEEEAIINVKRQLKNIKEANECGLATKGEFNEDIEALETLIAEIEKKDKIIKMMAEEIDDCGECPHEIYEENLDCEHCEEYSSIDCWRQYFEKKVE